MTRVAVPPASVGQTVRTLDPRARFGVTVLAVHDFDDPASGFVPVSPDRPLKNGDLLVIAGRASDFAPLRPFVGRSDESPRMENPRPPRFRRRGKPVGVGAAGA